VPKTDASGNVTLTSDDNVNYAPGFNIAAYDAYLKSTGLIEHAGGIAPRNEFFSPWSTRVDVSVEQEVELFDGHRVVLEFDLFNLGNLLNKKWGRFDQHNFYYTSGVTAASVGGGACAAPVGEYCYSGTVPAVGSNISQGYPSSVWQGQVGIRYEF